MWHVISLRDLPLVLENFLNTFNDIIKASNFNTVLYAEAGKALGGLSPPKPGLGVPQYIHIIIFMET